MTEAVTIVCLSVALCLSLLVIVALIGIIVRASDTMWKLPAERAKLGYEAGSGAVPQSEGTK